MTEVSEDSSVRGGGAHLVKNWVGAGEAQVIGLNRSARLVLRQKSNYQQKENYPRLDYLAGIRVNIFVENLANTFTHTPSYMRKEPSSPNVQSKNNASLFS